MLNNIYIRKKTLVTEDPNTGLQLYICREVSSVIKIKILIYRNENRMEKKQKIYRLGSLLR